MESCCSFGEFYGLSKRFIQSAAMVMARENHGSAAAENIQDLMDLSWGLTEACFACGGYGGCKYCDYCGDVLHDDVNCGDFYVTRQGINLCPICQNSDHRYKWFLSPDIERERLAMRLWGIRMERLQNKILDAFSSAAKGGIDGVTIDPNKMLISSMEVAAFTSDPDAFSENHKSYMSELREAFDNFECLW
ncbi:hypothetical protein BdWA1_001596 [Babesia duncani]|uniref:Uncharacterized protein n=1 Tax=Babesia duncani TaxID=323732 RepID=A0AAD9PK81_9APIC|nr:hypothetical protein BdWA1_001596 [Babesia duncani]